MPAWTDNAPVGNPLGRGGIGILTIVMAGSLLVFLRRDIGIRLLIRRYFVVAAALLIGFSYVQDPFDMQLTVFALAVVVLVFIHRARHMRRIKRGVPEWHSFATGRSVLFSFLPLPRVLVQIVIEPVLCGALGWWLAQQSNSTFYIGWWIVISAGLLFIMENEIRISLRERLFDLGDTIIDSVNFARWAERFKARPGQGGGTAGKAGAKPPQDPWFRVLWEAAQAAYKAQREAAEQQRRQQEEAQARSKEQQEQQQRREQQEQQERDAREAWRDPTAGRMTPEQALEILELKPGATPSEIRAAYNRLIQKVHPDAGGSTFFAKQLNMARDTLLKPQRSSR